MMRGAAARGHRDRDGGGIPQWGPARRRLRLGLRVGVAVELTASGRTGCNLRVRVRGSLAGADPAAAAAAASPSPSRSPAPGPMGPECHWQSDSETAIAAVTRGKPAKWNHGHPSREAKRPGPPGP